MNGLTPEKDHTQIPFIEKAKEDGRRLVKRTHQAYQRTVEGVFGPKLRDAFSDNIRSRAEAWVAAPLSRLIPPAAGAFLIANIMQGRELVDRVSQSDLGQVAKEQLLNLHMFADSVVSVARGHGNVYLRPEWPIYSIYTDLPPVEAVMRVMTNYPAETVFAGGLIIGGIMATRMLGRAAQMELFTDISWAAGKIRGGLESTGTKIRRALGGSDRPLPPPGSAQK